MPTTSTVRLSLLDLAPTVFGSAVHRRQFSVRPGDRIEVDVLAHGGFVATISPIDFSRRHA